MKVKTLFFLLTLILVSSGSGFSQDTLRIGFPEFLAIALENSGQMKVVGTNIELAENQTQMAKDQRFLPSLSLRSEHAIVPSVDSPGDYADDQIYLDPDATNDWSKVGLYTRVRLQGVQPVFTWGAINKAINAAKIAARATEEEYNATQAEIELILYDLYYSYVFALEIERLLTDAEDKIEQIERALEKQREENPEEADDTDEYKFRIFKAQFDIQREEVAQSLHYVKETWNYALRNALGIIYEPQVRFLDPVQLKMEHLGFYQKSAKDNRPELLALELGKEALTEYIESLKSQNLPGLYLGFTTTFASTPIRPRQPNPFISTPENTFNTAIGFTIRQNLNFFQAKTSFERSKLEVSRLNYLKDSQQDLIILEVNDAYRKAALAEVKVEKTGEALQVAKEWLRMEQLDYDFGFGDSKDLVDAVRQELELRLSEMEGIFELNSTVAKLNKSAGIPLTATRNN
ncbi:MAG: TolC family protein [Balneola sp.]|nr:MAG: TolC family protein [Balneola sp.]